jgi:hypothetical protein
VGELIEASPLGEKIEQAQQRVTQAIERRFDNAGYDAETSQFGAVGAMAVVAAGAGWGATKVLSFASTAFSNWRAKGGSRHERFDNIDDFVRATNDPMPNAKYTFDGVTWKTDRLGRLDSVEGPVSLNPVGRNDPVLQRRIGYNGPDTDVGFHVWPDQWGGPTSMVNVVAGNGKPIGDGLRNLNNGDYADFERKVTELAKDPNKQVEARVTPIYADGNTSRRPDFFNVSYRVDGGEWQIPQQLENKWKKP